MHALAAHDPGLYRLSESTEDWTDAVAAESSLFAPRGPLMHKDHPFLRLDALPSDGIVHTYATIVAS